MLTEAQEKVMEKAKKEYDRNLKMYSLDRAVEIIKVSNIEKTAESLIDVAEKICDYITKTPKEWPIPTEDEASAQYEQMKVMGEA